MKKIEADRFRRACKKLSERLGTPAFEGALLEFYVCLAALKKSEMENAN